MSDWEKAIAHWLPDVWTPEHCEGSTKIIGNHYQLCRHGHISPHDVTPPPPSRELGFRLLEAMITQCGYDYIFNEIAGHAFGMKGPDPLTAITKAAATLASKEQK